jgi:hypothetical protein
MSGLEHFDRELHDLDLRIGQLARLCDADLSRADVVVALIHGNYAGHVRGSGLDRAHFEELRGLLMLRYRVEEKCLAEMDVDACIRMVDAEHARLRAAGLPTVSN